MEGKFSTLVEQSALRDRWNLVIKKEPFGPFFFNNQRLVGREYKYAIHKVPSIPLLSGTFACAHVVS